jgi:hypothetical protein
VLAEGGPSQYVLIYDMKDFSFTKNFDVEAIRKVQCPFSISSLAAG